LSEAKDAPPTWGVAPNEGILRFAQDDTLSKLAPRPFCILNSQFLILQYGFLQRTPRGRVAAKPAYQHLGYPEALATRNQAKLF
jgi:hypothetical protein